LADSGDVYCWGSTGLEGGDSDVQRVTGLATPALAIAAGGRQTCAIVHDRRVQCWGDGKAPSFVPGTAASVELALGDAHGCVRDESGRILCWGDNHFHQLGFDLPFHTTEFHPPKSCPQINSWADQQTDTAQAVVWSNEP